MKLTLCTVLIATSIASPAYAAEATAPATPAARSQAAVLAGVDRGAIDGTVRAQDDFFHYSQGEWLKTVEIPADRSDWGVFRIASENVDQQLRSIIEEAEQSGSRARGSSEQQVGDFYASFMDEARRDALGLAPLKAELASIASITDKQAIAAQIARLDRIGVVVPLGMYIHQDNRNSTQYVAEIAQSGLGLPNRDYYLELGDAKMADTRAKYQLHLEKLLALAGHENAAAEAGQILALETELARVQWTNVANRDPVATYNKLSLAQLATTAPGLDWSAYLSTAGLAGKIDSLIVSQPSFLSGFDAIVQKTPLPVLKAYFEARLLSEFAPYLSQPFVAEGFAFSGKVLTGAEVDRPLQKRAITAVNDDLGEVVGKIYVARFFPEQRKQQVQAMAQNFLAAFKDSIETLDWMTPATRQQAQIKLSKVKVKIGYPDKWRDYSALTIARDDLVGNLIGARQFDHEYEVGKLGKPIDRDEWGMTPQTVNAYYNPEMNEVVFPAARLQSPLYDIDAEPAFNYGSVGISIGHEISHAFDDQGAQYDGDGNLRNWWTPEDGRLFAAKGKLLVAQYNGYSPLPGYTINGELTLGENIADNAGAIMALRAYRKSLAGKPAPVIDGWTAEQRFFFGVATARRSKVREPRMISQLKSDPHSPSEFRVNGALRNHPAFYEAFWPKPGDGNLRNWWTPEDGKLFAAKGKLLVGQYNGYSPLPGYTINGELTLGENIADNAGAIMALRAYRKSLAGKPAPVIDGWTAEQRFFFGLATARRSKAREPRLISQIKSDPHSPSEFRVNGALRNHPGFYEAFSVKPGDGMYLAPEQRVLIW